MESLQRARESFEALKVAEKSRCDFVEVRVKLHKAILASNSLLTGYAGNGGNNDIGEG